MAQTANLITTFRQLIDECATYADGMLAHDFRVTAMFWSKKATVKEERIAGAFRYMDSETKKIWTNLHSKYLSDLKIIGGTAIDGFNCFQMHAAFEASDVSKLKDAPQIFERCLISFLGFLTEQQGFSLNSPAGREQFGLTVATARMAIAKLCELQSQYTGKEFLIATLHEVVYKPFNGDVDYPVEFKRSFIQQFSVCFTVTYGMISSSLD